MHMQGKAGGPGPILCVGAAVIDRKLRTFGPALPATSNPARATESHGGVARNIAENLARLSAPVTLLSALGRDSAGDGLRAHLHELGISTAPSALCKERATGSYTAVLDANGDLVIGLADMAICEEIDTALIHGAEEYLRQAAMVVADLNLSSAALTTTIEAARRHARPLVLVAVSVPKMLHLPHDLCGVTVLILNRDEWQVLADQRAVDSDALRLQLLAQGLAAIIVTEGADGAILYTPDHSKRIAAQEVEVVDVTGAGDAFSTGVCWALACRHASMEQACHVGAQLAAQALSTNASCVRMTAATLDAVLNTNRPAAIEMKPGFNKD